mgnify:CR=1 FL=1
MKYEESPYSVLGICNAALSRIGEAPLISLNPNQSSAARYCHLHYHPARRETLTLARWTFATRSATLYPEADMDTNSPYAARFNLPSDCLRVLDVDCNDWTLQGRRILARASSLRISYIADLEDGELFDPLFTEALVTHLAEKLAVPLTTSQSLRQSLAQEFHKVILPLAATTNAVQSHSNDTHPLKRILGNRVNNPRRICE